ncbi:MAG: pyridoxal phosphate-dependent aminotransferase [Actinobacteria bacterium]|nr:MAG: pyridoxal phosphate-dependent aminotransferase [Actinomycetota bacterium]
MAHARISQRVGSIEESATLAIDARVKALKAEGADVIGFGAGEPDFPTPEHIVVAAETACRDPRFHHYTPTAGLPELRTAVADKTAGDLGMPVKAAQVLVTNGAKQALYNTFATLLDPGDEVLFTSPYWVTYPESIRLAGGVPVPVPADELAGFRPTVDQLEAARTSRTKVLLFASPQNPTGAVHRREEVDAIGRWAADNDLWVVTDEIYQLLVYGDVQFSSIVARVPELAERSVVINGVSKTYSMTGWRVGWMVGPPDVITAATNLQSHATSNVDNVAQAAALAGLTGPMDAAEEMRAAFDRRRKRMIELLCAIPGVSCVEPHGAFYAFPSFEGALDKELGPRRPTSTIELAEVILEEARVAIVPGEAFGAPGYMRLSYALGDDDLEEGLSRIAKLLS